MERAQLAKVEDRAQVDVEAIGALPREERVRPDRVDRLLGERGVVGDRVGADVARRAREPLGDDPGAPPVDAGDPIELLAVPGRVGEVLDLARVVQEDVVRSLIGEQGVELELVGDVSVAVTVVVDEDLVHDVVAELVEVWPARRLLERNVVRDDRDGVGVVGADERVEVRAVSDRVLGDFRGFSVRRHVVSHLVRSWLGLAGRDCF